MTKLLQPSEDENKILMKMVEDCGVCTVWELFKEYGIDKQKTCRYIRAGKLLAFMKGFKDKRGDEYNEMKWYIVKNQALNDFILTNRKK